MNHFCLNLHTVIHIFSEKLEESLEELSKSFIEKLSELTGESHGEIMDNKGEGDIVFNPDLLETSVLLCEVSCGV